MWVSCLHNFCLCVFQVSCVVCNSTFPVHSSCFSRQNLHFLYAWAMRLAWGYSMFDKLGSRSMRCPTTSEAKYVLTWPVVAFVDQLHGGLNSTATSHLICRRQLVTCVLLLLCILELVNSKLASFSFLHMHSNDFHQSSKITLSFHATFLNMPMDIIDCLCNFHTFSLFSHLKLLLVYGMYANRWTQLQPHKYLSLPRANTPNYKTGPSRHVHQLLLIFISKCRVLPFSLL